VLEQRGLKIIPKDVLVKLYWRFGLGVFDS